MYIYELFMHFDVFLGDTCTFMSFSCTLMFFRRYMYIYEFFMHFDVFLGNTCTFMSFSCTLMFFLGDTCTFMSFSCTLMFFRRYMYLCVFVAMLFLNIILSYKHSCHNFIQFI